MNISSVQIPSDIDKIIQTTNLAFSSTPDSNIDDWFDINELVNSIKDNRGVCLKATTDGGEIVGVIHAMQENPINGREGVEKWVITNLAIVPEKTGQGIGSLLIKAIETEAIQKQVKKIFVHTNLEDTKVIHFYEKSGYKKAGEIKDYYYNGSAIFLLKHL